MCQKHKGVPITGIKVVYFGQPEKNKRRKLKKVLKDVGRSTVLMANGRL